MGFTLLEFQGLHESDLISFGKAHGAIPVKFQSMTVLHNRISQKELKEKLYRETSPRTTISFYRYVPIDEPPVFRDQLYKALCVLGVFGRIYVAREGINAQISIPTANLELLKQYLDSVKPLEAMRLNIAVDDDGKSFWVLKVKVRAKIVADGISDPTFDMRNKGNYLNAEQFNALTDDPQTVVVDMRNHYEFEVGHFVGAREIPSDTFRDQLPMSVNMLQDFKDKHIIMYCTGGIRCEKASAYLLHHGFGHVYHLEGGIIQYAHTVKQLGLPNKFLGKNFVFDNRLGERIGEEVIATCHQCGRPSDRHVNCKSDACHLLFIQCEECAKQFEGCCSGSCQEFVRLHPEEQIARRKGQEQGRNIFNKSRQRLRPERSDANKR
jgi:UPF0176 protein